MTEMVLYFGLGLLLLYFTFTDIRSRVIPNMVTYPVIVISLIYRLFVEPNYLWGLIPACFFAIIFFCNPKSIGGGDIKMFACIGIIAGLPNTLNILLWTCLAALVYITSLKISKRSKQQVFPLAPFTAIGYIAAMSLNVGGLA